MMRLPSLPKLSPQEALRSCPKPENFDRFAYASWGKCRTYASERSKGYTENFVFNIYTPIGQKCVSIGSGRHEDDINGGDGEAQMLVKIPSSSVAKPARNPAAGGQQQN